MGKAIAVTRTKHTASDLRDVSVAEPGRRASTPPSRVPSRVPIRSQKSRQNSYAPNGIDSLKAGERLNQAVVPSRRVMPRNGTLARNNERMGGLQPHIQLFGPRSIEIGCQRRSFEFINTAGLTQLIGHLPFSSSASSRPT